MNLIFELLQIQPFFSSIIVDFQLFDLMNERNKSCLSVFENWIEFYLKTSTLTQTTTFCGIVKSSYILLRTFEIITCHTYTHTMYDIHPHSHSHPHNSKLVLVFHSIGEMSKYHLFELIITLCNIDISANLSLSLLVSTSRIFNVICIEISSR